MTTDCQTYSVHETEDSNRVATEALSREFHPWEEVRIGVVMELELDPKGLKGEISGIERIGDSPMYGRRLNTEPPITIYYEVDDDDCEVHPLFVFRVPYEQF